MAYRNEAYFKKLEERKGMRYLLAGLAGIVALGSAAMVGDLIYERTRKEKPSLERTITAPENPQSQPQENTEYEEFKNPEVIQTALAPAPKPIQNEVIILDPGHGMGNRTDKVYDPGAVSGEYKEAEVVLNQANKIKELLEAKGYTVFLTRTDATTPTPLGDRTKLAQDKNANVFVSLHYNAADSGDANGTEVLYNGDKSQILAQYIQKAIVNAVGTRDRGIKERTGLRVLKGNIPSALVETGFLSNSGDRDNTLGTYADEQAIADGIDAYLRRQ